MAETSPKQWKIKHAEAEPDGTLHVCRVVQVEMVQVGKKEKERVVRDHHLQTAHVIPPPGPERGPAIAALRQYLKDLPDTDQPDYTEIEDALNA